eukprot:Rmarinus@m.18319
MSSAMAVRVSIPHFTFMRLRTNTMGSASLSQTRLMIMRRHLMSQAMLVTILPENRLQSTIVLTARSICRQRMQRCTAKTFRRLTTVFWSPLLLPLSHSLSLVGIRMFQTVPFSYQNVLPVLISLSSAVRNQLLRLEGRRKGFRIESECRQSVFGMIVRSDLG